MDITCRKSGAKALNLAALLVAAMIVSLFTLDAQALPSVFPPVEANVTAFAGTTNQSSIVPGTVSAIEPCGVGCLAFSTASMSLTPSPSISSSASVSGGRQASSGGYIKYYFALFGPSGPVPVMVVGSASASGSGSYSVLSEMGVFTPPGVLLAGGTACVTTVGGCPGGGSIFAGIHLANTVTVNQTVSVTATDPGLPFGQFYFVTVATQTNAFSDGAASAFADPSIFIDPTFPNAHLYSLVLSDGVSNPAASQPSAVPEPPRRLSSAPV